MDSEHFDQEIDARQAVFEAVHQPGGSFIAQWMPDDTDGQFFKIDRAFEFSVLAK